MRARRLALGAVALSLAGAAAEAQHPAAGPEVVEVRIRAYKFAPERLIVRPGTTVRWVSDEKRASHSIWFRAEGLPESERLFHEERWERRFDTPGLFPYTCGPHPEMNGVIEVLPAGSPSAQPSAEVPSADGRWLAIARDDTGELHIVDAATREVLRRVPIVAPDGRASSPAFVRDAPARKAFIASARGLPYLWEVTYDPDAPPVYEGAVHDFRYREGIAVAGRFPPRRIRIERPIAAFVLNPGEYELLGGSPGDQRQQVVNLDVKRTLATLEIQGDPRWERARAWREGGEDFISVPLAEAEFELLLSGPHWEHQRPLDRRIP